jgi:KDO2-lipid IV(A) lauroyltransferase
MPRNISRLKDVRNWLFYKLVSFMVRIMRTMQRRTAIRITRTMGRAAFLVDIKDRRRAIRHLAMAFGEEKSSEEIFDLARRVFLHLGTAAADAFRLPNLIRGGLDRIVTAEGIDHLKSALRPGRGVIAVTAHLGNWELMAAWSAQQGYPVKVIGAPALDPRFDRMISKNRAMAGYEQISRGRDTRELIRSIRSGYSVGILIDQDTKVEGVFVRFFGLPAHTAVGPVVLAQKYGMAIVPMFIVMKEDRTYRVEIQEPVQLESTGDPGRDLAVNTQKCSDRCEDIIRRYPEQWVWMHRRWKKKPKPAKEIRPVA